MLKFTCTENTMYPNGKWELTCPKCGHEYAFFIAQPTTTCSMCGEELPQIKKLATDVEARLEYHTGGTEDE